MVTLVRRDHNEPIVRPVRDWVRRANRPSFSPITVFLREAYYFVTRWTLKSLSVGWGHSNYGVAMETGANSSPWNQLCYVTLFKRALAGRRVTHTLIASVDVDFDLPTIRMNRVDATLLCEYSLQRCVASRMGDEGNVSITVTTGETWDLGLVPLLSSDFNAVVSDPAGEWLILISELSVHLHPTCR